jgi:hypothetical protein
MSTGILFKVDLTDYASKYVYITIYNVSNNYKYSLSGSSGTTIIKDINSCM